MDPQLTAGAAKAGVTSPVTIREARDADFEAIWAIIRAVVSRGDTYTYDRDLPRAEGHAKWMTTPARTYVAEHDGKILGTYYLKANHGGGGSHVCNCGYMVSEAARGLGLATAMCEHSQSVALELGFKAMQFNFVVSTNEGAVRLWRKLGFEIVGTVPRAFDHPAHGYVDALVMYKWLAPD